MCLRTAAIGGVRSALLCFALLVVGCDSSTAPDESPLKVTAAMTFFSERVALTSTLDPAPTPRLRLDVTIQNLGMRPIAVYGNGCGSTLTLFADSAHTDQEWTSPIVVCSLVARKQTLKFGEQLVWTSSYADVPAGTYFGVASAVGVGEGPFKSIDAGSITIP